MPQTRDKIMADGLEIRTEQFSWTNSIDMGATQEERDAFIVTYGTPDAMIDIAFNNDGYRMIRAEVYVSNDPTIIGGPYRRVETSVTLMAADLIVGAKFDIEEGCLEGVTERYVAIRFNTQGIPTFTMGAVSACFLIGHKDMKSKLTFDVNGPEDEGKLEYLLDDDVFDTWVYDKGRVTALERLNNIQIHYPQAVIGDDDRAKWLEFIRVHYAPAVWPRSCYTAEFEKNSDNVTLMIKINGVVVETDNWDANTNYISYGVRPAIDWTWADFFMYSKYLKDFMNAIETFDKQS